MTLSAAAGNFNTGTAVATTTVPITGVGFQPAIVFFWWSGRTETTDTAGRADHKRGFGVGISSSSRRFITSLSQDTPTTMLTNKAQDDAQCIQINTTADAVDGNMDVQSMDADGFTLIVDDQFTADYRIHYLALGGADITNTAIGNFNSITTTGDQDVTTVGFQPDLVICMGNNQGTMTGSVVPDSTVSIGAATATQQAVLMGGSNDAAATSQAVSYCTDTEFIATPNSGHAALAGRATFVTMLSNGFRINWNTSSGAADTYGFVALKGGLYWLGSVLTQTDTVTDIVASGLGFTPVGALVFSHGKAESTTGTMQDDDESSIGGFSSASARAACAVADDDAAATAIVSTAIEHDEVYVNLNANTGAVEGLMDIKSMDADGFTLIMDDADPSQAFAWYIAFGEPSAPATLLPRVFSGVFRQN